MADLELSDTFGMRESKMNQNTYKLIFGSTFIILIFFIFCAFLLIHKRNRKELCYQLAASLMFGLVFFNTIRYGGLLHMNGFHKPMSSIFCWIYGHLEFMNKVFVPSAIFIITVERLMFVKDPIGYAEKITKAGTIIMLIFPYLFALLVAIPSAAILKSIHLSYNTDYGSNATNETMVYWCYLKHISWIHYEHLVVRAIIMLFILGNIACIIAALVMWCPCKCKSSLRIDYTTMGEEIVAKVKSSIIIVCIINAIQLPMMFLDDYAFTPDEETWNLLGGIVFGIAFITVYADIRNTAKSVCCSCCEGPPPNEPSVSLKEENVGLKSNETN